MEVASMLLAPLQPAFDHRALLLVIAARQAV